MPDLQSIQEYRLDNGLKVLIKQMRTAPVVSVWIWYRVGSRYERPGITGVSHWVEHMLFKGTPNFAKGEIFKSICRVGGMNNGFTSNDDTVYFETLPEEHLDLALRIEADRMVNSTFEPAEVESERTVIISEREGAENYPQMRLWEEVQGAAYQVHPYRCPVVGYKCDLLKITRDDLLSHYRDFYAPDNATLVIVGPCDPEKALEQVKLRFGDIAPSGQEHEVRPVEPEQSGERRVEVRRPGNAVYWACCYHIPAHSHEDRIPLMVLEAILSGARSLSFSGGGYLGKSARLHDALVNRKKVTIFASGRGRFMKDPGLFSLWMMLRDGVKPQRAEKAMFGEIGKLKDGGPRPAELKKALRQVHAQVEYARDGITANAYMIGKQDSLGDLAELDTLVERVAAVTGDDVVRVARTYLTSRNRTVGVFIPEGVTQAASAAAIPQGPAPGGPAGYSQGPMATWLASGAQQAGPCGAPAFSGGASGAGAPFPVIQERMLDCGIRVLGIENSGSHCVVVSGFLRGGASLDPTGREGLAYLTARMLDQGTHRKSCRQIAAQTDRLGASIGFRCGADSVGLRAKCLPGDLPRVLGVLRECLSEMAAPEAELEKVRTQTLTSMKADRDSPRWMATRAVMEGLYPAGHPYHRDRRGVPETIAGIGRDDVVRFAGRCFGPQALTLVLVGPLPFDLMARRVEKAFSSWTPLPEVPSAEAQPVSAVASPGEKVITMPGKSQCDLVVARIAVPRTHPHYHALAVASTIFGRFGLMGRIGDRVREEMGLAYYASAALSARLQAGHWSIQAGVAPANVRKALDAIRDETERFYREPVTPQELDDAKGNMSGSLLLRLDTSDSLCRLAGDIAFHNLPLNYVEQYLADVRATTAERVLELAREYLQGVEPIVVIAGPELPGG